MTITNKYWRESNRTSYNLVQLDKTLVKVIKWKPNKLKYNKQTKGKRIKYKDSNNKRKKIWQTQMR